MSGLVWSARAVARAVAIGAALSGTCLAASFNPAVAAPSAAPAIRTGPANAVPACVTPARLMAFLKSRNEDLDPRFANIAAWYKRHGEALKVRWDYAFFQMAVETNFLKFHRADGRRGDVDPSQNNFAGIGATGGGVPGDSFPDVETGVRAQLEHLVVYSGERLAAPLAPRTRLKQDDILSWTEPLARTRPVTFQDLAGKWAVDRAYGRTIEAIAESFRSVHCTGQQIASRAAPRPEAPAAGRVPASTGTPAARTGAASQSATGQPPTQIRPLPPKEPAACRVLTASYGGSKTILIRHVAEDAVEFTALRVLDGFERSMVDSYVKVHAPGGVVIGEFPSSDAAFARAFEFCPGAERRAG